MRKIICTTSFKVAASIVCLLGLLTKCVSNTPLPQIINNRGEQFAGSQACKSCHAGIYNSYLHTAHYFTSSPGEKEYIKGNFEEAHNTYYYTPYDRVVMEQRDSGLYQASYYKEQAKEAERIDIVIGSGSKGQTYLYWNYNALFQLPVSYFTAADSWANSPGNGEAVTYGRPVFARCLECHTTYIKQQNSSVSQFDKTQIIYGVSCESCHGAAAKHVQYQQQNPEIKTAKFIINPGKLGRQQQLDQCGLCHSGIQQNIQPAFTFKPGDTLVRFYKESNDSALVNDVHGSKYHLLLQSKCFRNSEVMTCTTCHNTHEDQKGNIAAFSASTLR